MKAVAFLFGFIGGFIIMTIIILFQNLYYEIKDKKFSLKTSKYKLMAEEFNQLIKEKNELCKRNALAIKQIENFEERKKYLTEEDITKEKEKLKKVKMQLLRNTVEKVKIEIRLEQIYHDITNYLNK